MMVIQNPSPPSNSPRKQGENASKTLSLFHPIRFVATGCGSGCVPKIGGTTGSLFACLLAWPIHAHGNLALLIAATLLFVVGMGICHLYLRAMPQDSDPKEIVVDEIAGQWFLLSVLPQSLLAYAIGFAVFRIFDIVKPFPISYADRRYKGAFGIMFDDLLAALYPVFLFMIVVWLYQVMGVSFPMDALVTFLEGRSHVQ